ncbi:MAG: type II toxin-antitoxin system RelE/ParE family toxin [Candidatus Micrarchaeota archaeon]
MPLEFSHRADKSFASLDKIMKERIAKKLLEIGNNPRRFIEGLTDLPFDKIRIGDYRLFVKLDKAKNTLFIADIVHRKNAYK